MVGKKEGMKVLSVLINRLIEPGGNEEILEVTTGAAYRDRFIAELVIR